MLIPGLFLDSNQGLSVEPGIRGSVAQDWIGGTPFRIVEGAMNVSLLSTRGMGSGLVVVVLAVGACQYEARDRGAGSPPKLRTPAAEEVGLSPEILARVLRCSPVPEAPDDPSNAYDHDRRAERLGHWLFFDPRFSASGEVSCASCHAGEHALSDARPRALGVLEGERNTQALWNVAHQRWFFWDGRADSLWAQALGPFEGESEHASSRLAIAHQLAADPALSTAYEAIFGPLPDLADRRRFPAEGRRLSSVQRPQSAADIATRRPIRPHEHIEGTPEHQHPDVVLLHSALQPNHPHELAWRSMAAGDREAIDRLFANLGKALAAHMRRLESRDSPFDRFVRALRGEETHALAEYPSKARAGLELFFGKARCHLCHHGPLLSDGEFHDIGLAALEGKTSDAGRQQGLVLLRDSEFNLLGVHNSDSSGLSRAKVELLPQDAHGWSEFKTPSLRNVAVTGPYFHDGRAASLREVLEFYSTRSAARHDPPTPERILVPLGLAQEEIDSLIAFLESLTDTDVDPSLLRPPASPGSTHE